MFQKKLQQWAHKKELHPGTFPKITISEITKNLLNKERKFVKIFQSYC